MSTTQTPRVAVAVLGSTGSIGVNTLDVIARHPQRFEARVLTGQRNVQRMLEQCIAHRPAIAVMSDAEAALQLERALKNIGVSTRVLAGADNLETVCTLPDIDVVMAAIVGAAGLKPTLAAARAGKRILLANKESLVMSGPILMQAIRASGARLIPIDSEHNAIFQCLPGQTHVDGQLRGVRRIVLTASGGPFLRTDASSLAQVTPEQACAHPRWKMGRKISVDSATLMNKGLELIEACLLFDMNEASVDVVVHPQSIVHSMVEFLDGSVLAQLGNPDMRTPIAHALGWPDRLESGVESLDLVRAARLEFEAPDLQRFPCLRLGREAARAGGTAPAVLNAANEIAVAAFLDGRCGFMQIPATIERVLERHRTQDVTCIEDVLAADAWARAQTQAVIGIAAGEVA